MEEQNYENGVQFPPLATNYMAEDAYGLCGDHHANHYYVTPGSNRMHHERAVGTEWTPSQQMPKNYVEFLAERGNPADQRQMPYNVSSQIPGFGLSSPSHLEHPGLRNVGNFDETFTGLEPQYGVQEQNWNESHSHAFQAYSGLGTAALESVTEARQRRSRERACAADRLRRLKISHWLEALKELMPQPEGWVISGHATTYQVAAMQVGKAALLDNVIDHVKYLQNQVKGHGHYVFQAQMLNGPVEHTMGKLIDFYPSAVTELLQSRGLIAMPMTFAEELLEPIEMFDVQEKDVFSVPSDRASKFGLP
ncbi:basic helix-loop-helix (bHLH) DNA-bindingsuperfamily protein [Striga asiatica]|uniref:Basic helix-loop-helix (BHLH) DNA-bindingsuperfamily protein n=1 Tax=Striga asiatica TaxID=4170 RepID=A0A5A7NWC8_STRAF|nr:basic helix-loop-helix (bHLH) DNA-bindingsuperfamily protein [Striga asiatica]